MKKRRLFWAVCLCLCLCLLLAAFLYWRKKQGQEQAAAEAPGPVSPVTLAIGTDIHYLAPELTDQGAYFQNMMENADGKMTGYSQEILEAFIQQILAEKPDALLLSGNLTFNGERQSHQEFSQKLQEVEDAGIPVLVIPGNHDLLNPMAAAFEGNGYRYVENITPEEFEEIYYPFGYENALSKDEASLSYVVSLNDTLRILLLDVNTPEEPGRIKEETLAWAEEQLKDAAAQGAWVLAVSHQNILAHSTLLSEGYVIENSEELLALLEKYPVICNLSGHIHMQHTAQSADGFQEIATSSLAVTPHQYGIIELDGQAAAYHTVPVRVSEWASKENIRNQQLLHFEELSRGFFYDTSYRQAAAALDGAASSAELAAFFAEVNTAYFSGNVDSDAWDTDLFDAWQSESGFFPLYLRSIAEDGFKDHTKISFVFGR